MNAWQHDSNEYWFCALWDVRLIDGMWWASDSESDDSCEHGPFATAEAAMRHCDRH